MKLLKNFLSAILSFGIVFSSALSLRVFAGENEVTLETAVSSFVPKTLEECCLALDKIFSVEEKSAIKQSSVDNLNSYLRKIYISPLGYWIKHYWLYLPEEKGKIGKQKRSKLAELLLEHGADFDGSMELDYIMSSMILDNYRYYLLTGESVANIEDLAIDYWFNYFHCFNADFKREEIEKKMERWKKAKESRRNQSKKQGTGCIIA